MDDAPIRVLLVEDDPDDALLLRDMLAEQPLPRLEWTNAGLLEEAVARVECGTFDVVLLDLSLPDSRGLNTFVELHARCPEAPVVLLTGVEDEQLGLEAVRRGAEDYLIKGASDGKELARSLRYAVERSRRRAAERELGHKRTEVQAAREIQQRLFPGHPPLVNGYDIAGASYPAVETGGDYFDFIALSDGRIGLAIGDVTGHGLGPALVMAETRAYLRALMLTRSDPGEVLQLANRALNLDTSDECFVTLLLASLDPASGELTYASAGHTPGYVLDGAGEVRRELWSTGIPLGVEAEVTFGTGAPLVLRPADVVLFLTDGLTEAAGAGGELMGAEGILKAARTHRHLPAAQILRALYDAARAFQPGEQADDATAIVVKVQSEE